MASANCLMHADGLLPHPLLHRYKLTANKDSLSLERLRECQLLIIVAPREKFTASEFDALKSFVAEGGSLLISMGEGGEEALGTNINYLTEEYGIECNSDAVVRTVYHKYTHPKEVFIQGGILNPTIDQAHGAPAPSANNRTLSAWGFAYLVLRHHAPRDFWHTASPCIYTSAPTSCSYKRGSTLLLYLCSSGRGTSSSGKPMSSDSLAFTFPYGASLNVQKPAFPVLSSGHLAIPLHRPVAALWEGKARKGGPPAGRICVLGSAHVLHDDWLDKDDNAKVRRHSDSLANAPGPAVVEMVGQRLAAGLGRWLP